MSGFINKTSNRSDETTQKSGLYNPRPRIANSSCDVKNKNKNKKAAISFEIAALKLIINYSMTR
jgi:hypothetical protein